MPEKSQQATIRPEVGSVTKDTASPISPKRPARTGTGGSGARHIPTYLDSQAEYIPVRKSDLREISKFGWLQEGAGAAGTFFVSGAFWAAITLLIEHSKNLGDYAFGFGLCLLSVIFGLVLIWIAYSHFVLREQRISEYFKEEPEGGG